MSCPYFKEGYVGACTASESIYIPSIARMELYCFKEGYRFCPNLVAEEVTPEGTGVKTFLQDSAS